MEEEYINIGNINTELLDKNFNIKTNKLIITKERIEHIRKKHGNDFELYGKYMLQIIEEPDYILKDIENDNTVLFLKTINELNLQIVIKLQTESAIDKFNTVITFWHMRKRSYNQILKKNKIIYKKLDKKE